MALFDPSTKTVTPVQGVPKVWTEGQGGLLDVRVHPTKPDKIYFTYSEPVGEGATTTLAEATLKGHKLTNFKKLIQASEPNGNRIHFGSRIEFDGKGYIYITVGDRDQRERAQNLSYHQGKVLRIKEDGSAASDNPFVSNPKAKPEIWTYGHRSPQGLVIDPQTKELWLSEMGPRGGDEINILKPGLNYGWPLVTYGREYWGPRIGEKSKTGIEPPIEHWVPSISPSGMAFYVGKPFAKWNGNAFLANLSGQRLRRLVFDKAKTKVIRQEELLKDLGFRFRNVRLGPDGLLYLSTDNGHLARLSPLPK